MRGKKGNDAARRIPRRKAQGYGGQQAQPAAHSAELATKRSRRASGGSQALPADRDRHQELDAILRAAEQKGHAPLLVLLDELEDPHNLGALLRTADATGVDGILIPRRRSVPLNATVAKTSAGAIEYVPVARIGNVTQTLKELKAKGFWVAGADMDGTPYDKADLKGALVLVIGSEGHGMTRLVKEQCDFIVSLPMVGHINSLNASVAGSLLMYEALRQRMGRK